MSNIDRVFGKDVDSSIRPDYINTLFSKYLIPKLGMFKEVKEETYDFFRRNGTNTKAKWRDHHNNMYGLRRFNSGPCFLIVHPALSSDYGDEGEEGAKYYVIPDFERTMDQMVLSEKDLFQ